MWLSDPGLWVRLLKRYRSRLRQAPHRSVPRVPPRQTVVQQSLQSELLGVSCPSLWAPRISASLVFILQYLPSEQLGI